MSELRGSSGSEECPSNCDCSKKLAVVQRRLKKYQTEAKHQKLWTKYVTEWLLYKFAFDVNLRIKLSKEKGEIPESDDDDEEEKVEKGTENNVNQIAKENVQQQSRSTVQINNTRSIVQQGQAVQAQSKAKKRKIVETPKIVSKPQPQDIRLGNQNFIQPDKFTVLSLGTQAAVKAEVSTMLINHNNNNNKGNFEQNYDNVNENLESTSSNNMTVTTNRPRVQIVHEEDLDIDIKYDPFAEFNAQNNDDELEEDEEEEDDDKEQNEKDPFAELGEQGNQNHLSVAKTLTPFEQQINHMDGLWKTCAFNFQWVLDMKKYQTGVMPCTMFIKRDDIRQWFEYLPNKEKPELSRLKWRMRYIGDGMRSIMLKNVRSEFTAHSLT